MHSPIDFRRLAKLCQPVQNVFAGIEHSTREEIDEICAECKAEAQAGMTANRQGG
jgi:low affinity Fe/Cu permease